MEREGLSPEQVSTEITRLICEFSEKIKNGTSSPEHFISFAEIEDLRNKLTANTNVLYSKLLEDLLSNVDERELVRKKKLEYRQKGIELRTHRRAYRGIHTLQGRITYSRNVLIPADSASREALLAAEGAKSIAPLDCALGLADLPFKMSVDLMLRCAYWAQNENSYEDAENALRNIYNIEVNDDTIRSVTNYIGKLVYENDLRNVDSFSSRLPTGVFKLPGNKDGVIYIEAEGTAIDTDDDSSEGAPWKKNKLGIVYCSDDIHYKENSKEDRYPHVQGQDYIGYIGKTEDFKRHLFACAVKRGYGQYRQTVIISDGSEWVARMASEIFPDALLILDLFHLEECIINFAKAKFRLESNGFVPWVSDIRQGIEDGRVDEVLSQLDPYEEYPDCVNLYRFISQNRDAMFYPEYKKAGFLVGSSSFKNGKKFELLNRLKQGGMLWGPETAQYLLTLRTKKESGRWESDVVDYIHKYFQHINYANPRSGRF